MSMRGFTLIEALVAVTILTFAVVGPMVTASRVIVAAQTARDQLTASYLAQEGVEYVRALRDNAYLAAYQAGGTGVSQTAWTNFLSAVTQCDATANATRACTLHPVNGLSIGSCTVGSNCAPLYLSSGLYTTTVSGTLTPYTRTIQVYQVSASDERIVSTVSWRFHGTNYSVSVSDHLTPWQ